MVANVHYSRHFGNQISDLLQFIKIWVWQTVTCYLQNTDQKINIDLPSMSEPLLGATLLEAHKDIGRLQETPFSLNPKTRSIRVAYSR